MTEKGLTALGTTELRGLREQIVSSSIDEQLSLIGSANFTDRGQTRNIEVGVLVDDAGFARQVALQWQGLVNQKLVRPNVP